MAARTSTQTGNWTSTSTWGGSAAPVSGDTATVATGHVVTVDANSTVGDDSTGVVLECQGTGSLVIAPSCTLTVRGEPQINTGSLTLSMNSIFEWGSTAGTTNFRQTFKGAAILCAGGGNAPSSGNRATIRKRSGASAIYMSPYWSCKYDLSYVSFVNVGDSSHSCADPGQYGDAGLIHRFSYCNFTACGPVGSIGGAVADATGKFVMDHCTILNPPGAAISWYVSTSINTGGGGERTFTNNVVEGAFNCLDVTDLTCQYNQFYGDLSLGGAPGTPALWSDNFWSIASPAAHTAKWNHTNQYVYDGDATHYNVHVWAAADQSFTLDGAIVDMPFILNDDWGELFAIGLTPTGAWEYYLKNVLVLPVGYGTVSDGYLTKGSSPLCTIDTVGGLAGHHIKAEHCTQKMNKAASGGPGQSARGFLVFNEGMSSSAVGLPAGTITSVKSNLLWTTDTPTDLSYAVTNHGSGTAITVNNILTPTGATNNGVYNLGACDNTFGSTTELGTPYYVKTSGSVPGAGDITLPSAPTFVDSTRNLVEWGRSKQGLTGRTDAQAPADAASTISLMKSVNDDSADTSYAHTYLWDWVRAGWLPNGTNGALLRNAGHDGTDIGAVQGIVASSSGPLIHSVGMHGGLFDMAGGLQ